MSGKSVARDSRGSFLCGEGILCQAAPPHVDSLCKTAMHTSPPPTFMQRLTGCVIREPTDPERHRGPRPVRVTLFHPYLARRPRYVRRSRADRTTAATGVLTIPSVLLCALTHNLHASHLACTDLRAHAAAALAFDYRPSLPKPTSERDSSGAVCYDGQVAILWQVFVPLAIPDSRCSERWSAAEDKPAVPGLTSSCRPVGLRCYMPRVRSVLPRGLLRHPAQQRRHKLSERGCWGAMLPQRGAAGVWGDPVGHELEHRSCEE